MAKSKKQQTSLPNKNLHLRLSFLHQAALHLAAADTSQTAQPAKGKDKVNEQVTSMSPRELSSALSSHLVSHMKGVSRRSVIRLDQDVKRAVCKGCDQLLISKDTTVETVENQSKNQSKPWADVRVIKCRRCGTLKRFPFRNKMKQHRSKTIGKGSTPGANAGEI